MKTPHLFVLLAIAISYTVSAQPIVEKILQRGQDFRVVQTKGGGKHTELRNGMHYLEGGEWKETVEEIVPNGLGAESFRGPQKLNLSKTLNAGGVVKITTTDGKVLKGGFVEVRYSDTATGKTVTLGKRSNSQIELIPPNKAIYRNITDGIAADLLITYSSSGVESDIVLRELPPSPESVGLNEESTTFQVVTEFSDCPAFSIGSGAIDVEQELQPGGEKRVRTLSDDTIDFGEARFANGTAYWARQAPSTNSADVSFPVAKQWRSSGSQCTLIESVDYTQCKQMLKSLPGIGSGNTVDGFVIDYRLINANKTSSFNFNQGETYWIQPDPVYTNQVGTFTLSGPVTIQPGAVIKYNRNSALLFSGSVSVLSGNSPIIFTAADDNSIGESVSVGSPNGQYARFAFWYNNTAIPGNNIQLTRCQFRYCQTAARFNQNPGSTGTYSLTTCKFDNCATGVVGSDSFPVSLSNPSFASTTTPTTGSLTTISYSSPTYNTSSGDGFNGLNQAGGGGESVPDTMGAIGPDYMVESVNHVISIYSRGGTSSIETATLTAFFGVPASDVVQDVRVLFDTLSQRWYIAAIERVGSGKFLFAYSVESDPRGLLFNTKWKVSSFNLVSTSNNTDFPCVGYDSNGIYCSYVNDAATQTHSLFAFNKYRLFSGLSGYTTWITSYDSTSSVRGLSAYPTVSPDSVVGDSYCYLLMKQSPSGTGGQICYRRFRWNSSGVLGPIDGSWVSVDDSVVHYTDYYDLDHTTLGIPQPNGWPNANLGENGSKIGLPVMRSGSVSAVWSVGLQASGSYSSGTVDRTGVEILRLSVDAGGALGANSYGRIFDANTNPLWFNVPSIAVNLRGDSIISFNGANGTTPPSCYYSVVPAGAFSSSGPLRFYLGTDGVTDVLGDISATVIDPVSDLDAWCFQEWGDGSTGLGTWGTRIQKIHNP